jgi:uncharacterized protein with HEPN domain
MLRAGSKVIEYVEGLDQPSFYRNARAISAVSYELVVLGEATMRLSPALREQYSNVPWRDIAGMRHHLTHGYRQVMLNTVWEVATRHVPVLLDQLRSIQREIGSD